MTRYEKKRRAKKQRKEKEKKRLKDKNAASISVVMFRASFGSGPEAK
jgi:hypothetical protein